MINRVVLSGRTTKALEVKYTQSGIAVASFTLAVNRQFRDKDGNREADFINCVIWRKGAENLANFTHKGSLIGIDGHLQTRNYQDKDGKKVYVTEVVVDNFVLLESKKDNAKSGYDQQGVEPQNQGLDYSTDAFGQQAPSVDDVPFQEVTK